MFAIHYIYTSRRSLKRRPVAAPSRLCMLFWHMAVSPLCVSGGGPDVSTQEQLVDKWIRSGGTVVLVNGDHIHDVLEIDATACGLRDEDVAAMTTIPTIRSLRLARNRITEACIPGLSRLPALEALDLGNNGLSIAPASAHILAQFRRLKSLSIDGSAVSAESIEQLAQSDSLEQITLMGRHPYTPSQLRALSMVERLDTLAIIGGSIDLETAKEFGRFHHLLRLDLSSTTIAPGVFTQIANIRGLRDLILMCNSELRDNDVAALSQMTELETLSLHSSRVSDGCIDSISKMRALKSLSLDCSAMTGTTIDRLNVLKELRHLRLSFGAFAPNSIDRLQELSQLFTLSVGGRAMKAEIVHVRERMPKTDVGEW